MSTASFVLRSEHYMADHSVPGKTTSRLNGRLWTLGMGLLMFGLGIFASMFWDRIAVEHRTTSNETAIADLTQLLRSVDVRVEKLAAAFQGSGGTQRQAEINTQRLDSLEQNGSSIAQQTARSLATLEFTNARLTKLENTTEAITTTQSAMVASNHSLFEMAQDVKRLDLLAHSAEGQVSEKEFQAVRVSLEMHEKETNDRLLSLDNKVNQILTMMASDREKKRISMVQ